MSFFTNLFSGATPAQQTGAPAQQQQSAPAQPGNLPANAPAGTAESGGTASNGVVPAQAPAGEQPASSPLDQFKELWEPVSNEGAPVEPAQSLDPKKVGEMMSAADFSNVIGKENLAAISAGGDGAMQAFVDSMNAVARQVMTQSTLISNKMIDQQVKAALEDHQKQLPSLMKKQFLSSELSDNPVFKNPAVKPVVEAVQHQLAGKYPDASAKELAVMANQFIEAMAETLAPKKTPVVDPATQELDWDEWLK